MTEKVCENAVCTIFLDTEHNINVIQDSKDTPWKFLEIPLMRTNHVNKNGHLYPHDITVDAVNAFKENMVAASTAFMELDHPDWGKGRSGQPSNIAGMLVDVWWHPEDSYLLMGKAKLFDTDAGKTVRAIIDGGGRIGISQRAFGVTEDSEDGDKIIHKVIANYEIVAFDFVGHPATEGMRAGDTLLTEGEQNMKTYTEDEVKKLLEDKEAEFKDKLDAAEADVEAKVLAKAEELAQKMFDEKLEEAVAEKLEDAANEKAKELFDAQLEEFKKSMKIEDSAADELKAELSKKDEAIKELQDKLLKMELDTFIDSELADYEYKDKVLELMGEAESIEDAKDKIEKAKSLIDSLIGDKKEDHKEDPVKQTVLADADKSIQRMLAGLN